MKRYNSLTNQRQLYRKQDGVCNGCREPLSLRHLAVDHIVPRKLGGTHELSNLQLLCASCNSIKGKRSQSYLTKRLQDRNWISRRPDSARVHARVWTGSRWVDVFDLILYIEDPDSCISKSITGTKHPLFASDRDFHLACIDMYKGLHELLEMLESADLPQDSI
ncbi:MAG: HNH endonuclease [Gammaproteobacteria bacterium]|nr:HNH endonuclease [Gammaproteobacteria bacterium]MYD81414.1 HNH endonuclease [Gammaproteobacteria bacterium]